MYFRKKIIEVFSVMLLMFIIGLACKKENNPPTTCNTSNIHLQNGLLLYLKFNGNMADSSGNANQTTPVAGATLTYDEHGYANSAFVGTGGGERIKVTNNGSIKFDTAFSVSFIFMQMDQSHWQTFLSMVNPANGNGPSFNIGFGVLGGNVIGMSVTDSIAGCSNNGEGSTNLVYDTTAFKPVIESWYNLVATYRKGTVNIYINGKLISTKTIPANQMATQPKALLCPAAQVIVGGWWDLDPGSINGKIDEVRMYNRVLNSDEIAELAESFQ